MIRVTLEDIKKDKCIISIRQEDVLTQLNDATNLTIKVKKRNYKKGNLIHSNDIKTIFGEDGTEIYFILKDVDIQTGFEYQFILEIKDNEEKHEETHEEKHEEKHKEKHESNYFQLFEGTICLFML